MRAILLVVDMINDFIHSTAALPVPFGDRIIPSVNERIRYTGLYLTVFANDAHTENDPEFEQFPKHAVKGTFGAKIHQNIILPNKYIILEKTHLSAFDEHRDIFQMLWDAGADTINLAGVATEYCILHNAIAAVSMGFQVNLLKDAIAGIDQGKSDEAISLMLATGKVILI